MINAERSYTEYNVEVPTTDFPIGFDILDYGLDVVAVTLNAVDPTTLGYTVIQVNNTTYRFAPAVPSGVVRLTRITDIDQMAHVFTEGAIFISENMDGNFKQIRHAQQEVRDNFGVLQRDFSGLEDTVLPLVGGLEVALQAAESAATAAGEAADIAVAVQTDIAQKFPNGKLKAVDVLNASTETQQQINDFGGATWYAKVGGYKLGATVKLDNGDTVKSTEPANTVNPNVAMTGWVKNNSSGQIFDASGLNQQQINDLTLTPFHFGAVGDGTSHKLSERYTTLLEAKAVYPHAVSLDDEIDWCALIKFFMVFKTNVESRVRFDWSGKFVINKPLSLISTTATDFVKSIFGDLKLLLNNFGASMYVLRLHGRGLNLQSTTIMFDASRLAKYGILIGSRNQESGTNAINFGLKLGSCFIHNARINNIYFSDGSMFNSIDFYRGGGSGVTLNDHKIAVGNFRSAKVTAQTQSLSAEPLSNYTKLTVDNLPEESLSDTPIFIHYNNQVAGINSIDTSTNTLNLKTLILLPTDMGELNYIYGASIATSGSDSAGVHIKQMSSIGCGIALMHQAMYPCVVDYLCSEFSGIAVVDIGLVGGVCVSELYLEGDKWQYIKYTAGRPYAGGANFRHATGIDINKWVDLSTSQTESGQQYFAYSGAQGLVMYEKGVYHSMPKGKYTLNRAPTNIANGLAVDFNLPHQNYTIMASANITVGFTEINPQYNRLFAYDSQEMTIFGASTGAPSGTVTLVPPSGYTLNGSSSNLTFSGFTGAAHFNLYLQVVAKNIIVDCTSLIKPLDESGASLIPSGITNTNNLPVGKFWLPSTSTVTGLPTPTTGVLGNGNIKTYFSFGKIGEGHNKTQVVEYVSLFEKWGRVFSSASGAYGAWKLISYETKKGTTAQRPSNPQIGMRYYDTTLLATGRPIEWNGASWIDSSGVIV